MRNFISTQSARLKRVKVDAIKLLALERKVPNDQNLSILWCLEVWGLYALQSLCIETKRPIYLHKTLKEEALWFIIHHFKRLLDCLNDSLHFANITLHTWSKMDESVNFAYKYEHNFISVCNVIRSFAFVATGVIYNHRTICVFMRSICED